jgi:hypothetical protein
VSGNLLASRDLVGLSKKEIGHYLALWRMGILIVDTSLETDQPLVKHVFKDGLGKAVEFLSYRLK